MDPDEHGVVNWAKRLAPLGPRTLTTIFDLTNKCNLRCRQCYFSYDEVFHRPAVVMTPDRFEQIAGRLLPLSRAVTLSAATEPMASPHFACILEITARHHPIHVKLLTNATLMTEPIVFALLEHGVAELQISIDAASAALFERIRRGARFDRFRRNVARLCNEKRRRGAKDPLLQFNVTLMRSNLDELPAIVDLAAELGIEQIGCRHVVPYDELGMEEESLSREPLRANEGLAAMLERAARAGVAIVNFPDFFPIAGEPWHPCPIDRAEAARDEIESAAQQAFESHFADGPLGNLDGPEPKSFESSGHLELRGWALAARGPVVVTIERVPFASETPAGRAPELVRLGTAEFQNGTRPDVVQQFGGAPAAYGAGWVFRSSDPEPAWKVGSTMTVHAFAEDTAGRRTWLNTRRIKRRSDRDAEPQLYCRYPFTHVYVNPEGRLFPYPDCQGSDFYGILNDTTSFEDLWFGAVATQLRRRIIDRDPPEMCQRCPIFINRRVTDPMLFKARNTRSRYRPSSDEGAR